MHSPQGSFFFVMRNIALDNLNIESMFFKFLPAEGPCKKTPFIGQWHWLNKKNIMDGGLSENHYYITWIRGIGMI